ncbi:NAD(P)/FAD-dependent oxidoreductase, partial [bacterium]|nr:NAD(P)/FAD-dependent oxidoreductase [bacterium]
FQRGGMGAVSEAIAGAAREAGAEIRLEAGVSQILIRNGTVQGVALENGDELRAPIVASSLDPKRTLLKLIPQKELPSDFIRQIENYKIRGSSGKVNLALDALPNLKCMPGDGPHLRGAISISPSIEYLERAYDDAKYGSFSRKPYMDVIIPSMIDPSMAPPGKHVMSMFVQYAPYDLKIGTWEEQREAFGDAVINTLSEYIPNLKDIILHRQVLSPWDMEQKFGLTEGNIFQGELSLDQLFFLRPAAGWAQFRTPVRNFYICGSGAHPGGGVMGAPGRLAALEILKDHH